MTVEEFLESEGYAKPEYIAIDGKDVVKLLKKFAKFHIEDTCKFCAENALLLINNLSCTDKEYNDYYQCGDDEISVSIESILNCAKTLKERL